MNSYNEKICAVDLFCGAGGLTHGLINNGIDVLAGVDNDTDCAYPYTENNSASFISSDICNISGRDINSLLTKGEYSLVAGCAPCQPFSTYSQRNIPTTTDSRWRLLLEFGRLIYEAQPDFVAMENVPQLSRHTVFKHFLSYLSGYNIWMDVVDCVQYGVPQTRKRLILLASKLGPITIINPTYSCIKHATVRSVISCLDSLDAGQTSLSDPLHVSCSLSDLNLQRIKHSRPGGTWRDWPSSLMADCHKKHTGQTYPSVYGRMEWDKPAPTMTTQFFGYGNGRFGHPEQDRAISLREGAILQTFPKSYKFIPPNTRARFSTLGRLIGNAVPVRIGEVIAASLIDHLKTI